MALTACKECGKEISDKAEKCPHCGVKIPHTSGCVMALAAMLAIGAAIAIFTPKSSERPAPSPAAPTPKELALAAVSLEKLTWRKGGFDNVMFISATLKNNGDRPVKDVQITCELFSKSGTKIDRNVKTVFESVPAKGSTRLREFSMGLMNQQSATTSCEITNLVLN